MKKSRVSWLFSRNVCAAQQTNRKSPNDPPFLWRLLMNRVILSALLLVALLSGTYLLNGAAVAAESERPSQTLFGEGYKLLYQQDQQMMHEMMETLQDMMGTMKEMAKGADKEKIAKRMERMDDLMQEPAEDAS